MSNANDKSKMVSSLRDLPRSIEPPRDLWAGIEAKISQPPRVEALPTRRSSLRWLAAAAVIAALAVGMWIGRSSMRAPNTPPVARTNPTAVDAAAAVQAAYFADPNFRQQRTALLQSLAAKLATLPPESREKVTASLTAIHNSMHVLEEELGKDPTNALLQELLLNTYQDEMRVLTTVHEASDAGKGI
jgi:hypothetical protein